MDWWQHVPGVEDPTDGIVHELGLGVGLVATLVGDDPNASGDEASPEGIQRPERELSSSVQDWERELDDFRMDAGIEKSGDLVDSSQCNKICDAEGIYALGFTCQRRKEKETHT